MKYQAELTDVIKLLPVAQNILVAISTNFSKDTLAGALSLYLSLKQAGKKVDMVTDGTLKVDHSHLFGVGEIKNKLTGGSGGNLTIVLGGVVVPDGSSKGTIPALEKLEWFPNGSDLNLVFKVLPGQKFTPTQITNYYSGANYDLAFILGSQNLNSLGTINTQELTKGHLVNIDNQNNNQKYGNSNIVDTQASSVSEIITFILQSLSLPLEGDISSNLLSGIFEVTANLQNNLVGADTYEAVATALRSGGKKPTTLTEQPTKVSGLDLSQTSPSDAFKAFFGGAIATPAPESQPEPQPSPEEVPAEEEAVTPESDWLTPKIYKGSSVG